MCDGVRRGAAATENYGEIVRTSDGWVNHDTSILDDQILNGDTVGIAPHHQVLGPCVSQISPCEI